MPTQSDNAYSCKDLVTGQRIFFNKSGQVEEIPDHVGERLLNECPQMFGTSINDIRKARGMDILKIIKTPKEEEPEIKHPTIKAMKKVEAQIKKTKFGGKK